MKRKKININEISSTLSRSEMRKIMAGSGSTGGSGSGSCSGNWTIHPACCGYDGSNPNAIVCYDGGRTILNCCPPPGTNPQTACCG